MTQLADPQTFRAWIDKVEAFLQLGAVRRAKLNGPAKLCVVVIHGEQAFVWADERWTKNDTAAAGLLDELVLAVRGHGYDAEWVESPARNLKARLRTDYWPQRWYRTDLERIHARQSAAASRSPRQPV